MSILRDYRCAVCQFEEELFEEEFQEIAGICQHCGQDGLRPIISGGNVRTSSKTQASNIPYQPALAGVAFRVAKGKLTERTPVNEGEMITLKPGEKKVISLNPNPDAEKMQQFAAAMSGKKNPPKSKMH